MKQDPSEPGRLSFDDLGLLPPDHWAGTLPPCDLEWKPSRRRPKDYHPGEGWAVRKRPIYTFSREGREVGYLSWCPGLYKLIVLDAKGAACMLHKMAGPQTAPWYLTKKVGTWAVRQILEVYDA